jgi:hypothetical protein
MRGEIHVDDVGTNFRVTIKDENDAAVDVSTATVTFIFKKPDNSLITRSTTFVTDGTDGLVNYASVIGDLDQHGNWSLQAFVDYGSTEWYSDITKFKVYSNLGC